MKSLLFLSLMFVVILGDDATYDQYEYSEDDPEYEYEYIYEGEDCDDDDGDGYCDDVYVDEYEEDGPEFGEDTTHVKVDLGNTARISCSVHNLGSRVISWKRGESFLFLGSSSLIEDSRYSVTTDQETSTMTITLVRAEDAGDYTCQVATKDLMEQTFTIEIKSPPNVRIINKPSSGQFIVEEGEQVTIQCQGEGDPKPALTWKRLNSQLPPGLSIPHSDTLVFQGISESDAGTYQCVANNGFGHPAMDSIELRVKHKPKIYVHEEFETNKETEQVDLLKLICSVQAYPRAVTKWKRNDKEMALSRASHRHEDGRHIIEISRPRQSDIGVYTCEATNEMGSMYAVLNIEENDELPDTIEEELKEAANMIRDTFTNQQQGSGAAIPNMNLNILLTIVIALCIRGLQS